ncbi:Uncharacterized protein NEOC95_000581 [Neochlamydia sp. AcF95]|nr:Uncharacterized protein [Neochlamydia sp. AcF95]
MILKTFRRFSMDPTKTSWGNPSSSSWSSLASLPRQVPASAAATSNVWSNFQADTSNPENPSPSRWALQTTRNTAATNPSSPSSVIDNPSNALAAWSNLAQNTFEGQSETLQITQHSRNALADAAQAEGALSVETHNEQMRVVDRTLNKAVSSTADNIDIIISTIREFALQVQDANHQISDYCKAIIERAISNDASLSPDDIIKAKLIVEFSANNVVVMKNSSEAALDLASKGGSAISQQTLGTIDIIFKARAAQVTLFTQKLEVFQKQEQHDLDLIFKIQEVKLKDHAQFFQQLKEVIHLQEEATDGKARREIETRKADLEEQIQLRGQYLKEEESHNKHQLEKEALSAEIDLKKQAVQIEEKLTAIKEAEQKAAALNQELEIREKAKNEAERIAAEARTESERIAAEARVAAEKNRLEATIQKKQIAMNERTERLKTVASIVRPPCILQ